MPKSIDPIDVQKLIAEVAARHNLFLKPSDPAIALVTMNYLVFNDAMEKASAGIHETIAEFNTSYEKAERRAGTILAQEVKESAVQMRQGLQSDIHAAGLQAREYVHLVNEAHRHPALIRWSAIGLLVGAALFAGGVWVGRPCQEFCVNIPVG